jgi:hypothetical protein
VHDCSGFRGALDREALLWLLANKVIIEVLKVQPCGKMPRSMTSNLITSRTMSISPPESKESILVIRMRRANQHEN